MTKGSTLGQAIHKLRPDADARQETIKANQQALDDLEKSVALNKGVELATVQAPRQVNDHLFSNK
jgi:hypothetical protein